jgi:hypothetical protein
LEREREEKKRKVQIHHYKRNIGVERSCIYLSRCERISFSSFSFDKRSLVIRLDRPSIRYSS